MAFGLDPDSRTRFQLQEQDGFPRMVLTLPAPVETRRVSCRYRLVPAPQRERRLFLRRKTPGKHWLRIR